MRNLEERKKKEIRRMIKMGKIYKTREPEMGYTQVMPGLWRFVSLQDGDKAEVGKDYHSKAELLADLHRYLVEWGYEVDDTPKEKYPTHTEIVKDMCVKNVFDSVNYNMRLNINENIRFFILSEFQLRDLRERLNEMFGDD